MTGEMLNGKNESPTMGCAEEARQTPTGKEMKLGLSGKSWCSWHVHALRFDASGHGDETKEEAAAS